MLTRDNFPFAFRFYGLNQRKSLQRLSCSSLRIILSVRPYFRNSTPFPPAIHRLRFRFWAKANTKTNADGHQYIFLLRGFAWYLQFQYIQIYTICKYLIFNLNADKRFAAVNPITVLEITEMIEKYTHLQFHAPTDTIQKNGNAKVVIKSVRGIKNKEKLLSIPHANKLCVFASLREIIISRKVAKTQREKLTARSIYKIILFALFVTFPLFVSPC